MKRGIQKTFIFYAVGIALTAVVYFIFGAGFGHAPGPWMLMAFLTMLIGSFWMLSALRDYFFKGKTEERLGIIVSHTVVIVSTLVFVFLLIRFENAASGTASPDTNAEVVMEIMRRNDSIMVKEKGTIIFLKVGDSVHITDRDSLLNDIYQ